MEPKRTASIYPTVDEINALPKKFRQYIHDLENRCDKSGDVQTIAILRQDRVALQQRVEELEARIALQEREYLETPSKRIENESGFQHHRARVLVIT